MSPQLRRFPFVQFDVFASRAFEGNPLAVYPDGRGLSEQEMQSVAREMNLSETTFILPRDPALEKEQGVRVRIFTVREELPFAGHPTLGTAHWLREESGASEVSLQLNAGKVPVRFEQAAGQPPFGEMTLVAPTFGMVHDRETVLRATSLRDGDIDPSLPIQTVSAGLPFTIVPLRGLEVMRRLQVDLRGSTEYLQRTESGQFFYFVCRETVDPAAHLHARMLFYGGEDPATGSAAGCTAAWMLAHRVTQPEERALIEQGIEMQRPSQIFVRASHSDNKVVNVRVGGHAVQVLRGEISL